MVVQMGKRLERLAQIVLQKQLVLRMSLTGLLRSCVAKTKDSYRSNLKKREKSKQLKLLIMFTVVDVRISNKIKDRQNL